MPEESKKRKLDESASLYDDLKTDRLNLLKWNQLLDLKIKQEESTLDEIKELYTEFLGIFVFYAPQWVKYIKYVISKSENQLAEQLFSKCLPQIYDVELYRLYVSYVIKTKDIVTGGEAARSSVLSAFSFAVDTVGMDPDSEPLWKDYLEFVNNWNPINSTETQAKVDTKRNILRRIIALPNNKLPQWWSYYTTFETDSNSNTARKLINEKSSDYMNLRPIAQEFSNLTAHLNRSTVLSRENIGLFKSSQLHVWNSWIKWEKENKMKLAANVLNKRIDYVYKQSIQNLYLFPEVWCNYYHYMKSNDSTNNSKLLISFLCDALKINPQSFSLTILLSEQFEEQNDLAKVKDTFTSLIHELTGLYDRLVVEQASLKDSGDDKNKLVIDKEIKVLARSITFAYCLQMKTAKRLGGVKEARPVFSQCRKFPGVTWHAFVDNAMLEYHSGDKKIPLRLFELALKYFNKEIEFICKYMDFLIFLNDLSNVKTVFESSVRTFTEINDLKSLKILFKKFLKIQYELSDFTTISNLQKRYLEIFKDSNLFDLIESTFEETSENLDFNVISLMDKHNFENIGSSVQQSSSDGAVEPQTKKQMMIDLSSSGKDISSNSLMVPSGSGTEVIDESTINKPLENFVVGDEIYNLLRVLPKSQYYQQSLFDPVKIVELFKNL